MRKSWIGALVSLVCCATAASASADTFCVAPEASCAAGNNFPTISAALSAASSNGGAKDTVKLGAATYADGPYTAASGNPVDLVGKGSGQTVLTIAGSQSNATVLTLGDPSSSLEGVGFAVPAGSNNTGLNLAGSGDSVSVTASSGATSPTGVVLGGALSHSTVQLPSSSSNPSLGVSANNGALSDSTITADTGVSASFAAATVERSKLFANTGFSGGGTVEDSELTVKALGSTAPIGLEALAIVSPLTLTARHDTIVGDGSAGSVGVLAQASAVTGISASASVTLNDSILRGFATDLKRQGASGFMPIGCTPGVDPFCTPVSVPATINFDYDDYGGVRDHSGDGTAGTYSDGGHNVIGVDPKFVSAGATSPDYHLTFNSQLIDAGRPTVETGEATKDGDGNPRAVDGNGDGSAATDIGAYEYQHRPPVVTADATPTSAQTGTPFSFTATASDPDPGDTVTTVTWTFDDGTTGSGTSVSHAFSTAGTHTATATSTDSTGLTTASPVTVTVTQPGGGSGSGGNTGNGPPLLSNLKLTPTAFRAATRGPSISAVRTGTTVSYTDTQAANTTFLVERATPGVKRGHSCVKPSRGTRRGKRCTLFVPAGGFLHRDVAGVNRFHFSGRIFGRALASGNYRLDAESQNAALLVGNRISTQFRIVPPPPKRKRRH